MGLGLNGLPSFFSVLPKSHCLTSYKRWPHKGLETPDWEPAAWIPGSQTGWVAHAHGHLCVASVGESVSGSHGHQERGVSVGSLERQVGWDHSKGKRL